MATRFLVGNNAGDKLVELHPSIGPVSWRLNDVGQVKFALAKTDPKAVEEYLRYGNRVLLQFDNGLPDWGGVIDTPRDWSTSQIICTAYGAEYIFGFRQTDKIRSFSGATLGEIYRELISDANNIDSTGIDLGEIWEGGDAHTLDFHYSNLLSIFKDLLATQLGGIDFDVTAGESGGRIAFTANLYQQKGAELADLALVEGQNVNVGSFSEQGKIVNWWDLAGAGTGGGDGWGEDRFTSNVIDTDSRSTYGLRQDSQIHSDVSIQETLDVQAATVLGKNKDPHNVFSLVALDQPPARFADYELGDVLPVSAHSVGFGGLDTTVRVRGRSYDPATDLCELVVQEEL